MAGTSQSRVPGHTARSTLKCKVTMSPSRTGTGPFQPQVPPQDRQAESRGKHLLVGDELVPGEQMGPGLPTPRPTESVGGSLRRSQCGGVSQLP